MTALLLRDLKLAFRAGGGFGLGLAFFLIVVVLVPFGVGPQSSLLATIAPGILWLGAKRASAGLPLRSTPVTQRRCGSGSHAYSTSRHRD